MSSKPAAFFAESSTASCLMTRNVFSQEVITKGWPLCSTPTDPYGIKAVARAEGGIPSKRDLHRCFKANI